MPAACESPAWIAALPAISAPELNEGRLATWATPISTPFTSGAPAWSWAISAS